MAVVYDSIKGMPIEEAIAHQEDVQSDLDRRGRQMGSKAAWLLSAHRQEGHAKIEVEVGDIDRHIILDDSRGLLAAMSIEFGRRATGYDIEGGQEYGVMQGLFILHDATGLPR